MYIDKGILIVDVHATNTKKQMYINKFPGIDLIRDKAAQKLIS